MISDDDSFLSGYLDGQLDSDQHQWVESALVSNPQLAEQLRALTVLRDLVAGLARDRSVDVTDQVMERIRARRAASRHFPAFHSWPRVRRRRLAAAGALAAAAGVIVAISLAITHPLPSNPSDLSSARALARAVPNARSSATRTDAGAVHDSEETQLASSHLGLSSADSTTTLETALQSHTISSAESTASASTRDLEHVRKFLDNPNLRHFFLVRGGSDGKEEQLVASVVERTTRFGFFKFNISQGIVIDARHPEEATVFALLVSPAELGHFRDQLKLALADPIEETPVNPEIATQLADIGHVQAFHPPPLGDVLIPRKDVALLARVPGALENTGPPALPGGPVHRDRPTAEQEHSAPIPPGVRPALTGDPAPNPARQPPAASRGARRPDPAMTDDKVAVLVWIYKPRPG